MTIPSSANSIRSLRAWLLTKSCPAPGVEAAGEEHCVWVEDGGMEALDVETGVPTLRGCSVELWLSLPTEDDTRV